MMKRTLYVFLIATLCGCAPSIVMSKKTNSYNETITKLAVLVAEPGEMKSRGGSGGIYASPDTAGRTAIAGLNLALRSRIASYLSAHALPSDMISASEQQPPQVSHRLVLTPSSASVMCYYSTCTTFVRLTAALQDSRSKAIVWMGDFEVPIPSRSGADDEIVNKVGDLILGSFQSEKLIVTSAN